jgi:hypothetical protein
VRLGWWAVVPGGGDGLLTLCEEVMYEVGLDSGGRCGFLSGGLAGAFIGGFAAKGGFALGGGDRRAWVAFDISCHEEQSKQGLGGYEGGDRVWCAVGAR